MSVSLKQGATQVYSFGLGRVGTQLTSSSDTANGGWTFTYDEFNRVKTTTGTPQTFSYDYDRWGNRWHQNAPQGGPAPQISFDASTNRINSAGYTYDAAGNLTNDGFHSYTFDAEGNVIKVDSGTTATFTYDALNNRVRIDVPGSSQEFVFNPQGQRASTWNASTGAQIQGQAYWGNRPLAFSFSGSTHFQEQDWIGTERFRSKYDGSTEATFQSLPFGDASATSGSDYDAYHLAGLDQDASSNTGHASYRQYSPTEGRWLTPDPSFGSYDFTDPQSLNRYAYVEANPLVYQDPAGLFAIPPEVGGPCIWCDVGILIADGVFAFFEFGGGRPTFHGTLQPRADSDPGSLGESLGIPVGLSQPRWGLWGSTSGCDFGDCSPNGTGFAAPGIGLGPAPINVGPIILIEIDELLLEHDIKEFRKLCTASGWSWCSSNSGKENIRPSWAEKYGLPYPGESGNEFADRLCKAEFGPNGCPDGTGPGSDYSKLKKWADRRK